MRLGYLPSGKNGPHAVQHVAEDGELGKGSAGLISLQALLNALELYLKLKIVILMDAQV